MSVMTYTFKLSRRLARFRAAGLVALLLAAGGCERSDSLGPDEGSPEAGAPVTPELATGSFAGGIPMGMYGQPTTTFGSRYNGGFRNIWPQYLLAELAAIKARGGKVVLMFAGHEDYYKDAAGHFSFGLWKARIDRFRNVNFSSYVNDGTIIAHYLIDEPNDPANWSGEPVPGATIEEMAKYSKAIWPSMTTVVRAEPSVIRWSGTYRALDAAWAQYLRRKGDANDYIRRNVADAQEMGLGLVVGLNVRHGGDPNQTPMTAGEVESWGSALLSSSYPCAFISWQYDSDYVSSAGMGAAMDALRAKAQNRPTRSCNSDDGGEILPPPPATDPAPVSGALPFGVAFQPAAEYGTAWNGTAVETDPATVVQRLEQAGSVGMAVTATLAASATTRNADGTFNLTKWKAQVDRYRSLALGGYVTRKTLYLHHLVDAPRCAECWGGKPIAWESIEEMAKYSKAIWPALPTTVRLAPSALAKAPFKWSALDAGWAQYSTPRGDLRTFLAAEASVAKAEGLGLVAGLNLLDGAGPDTPPMSASQIREFGTTMAQYPAVCAMVGWSYDSAYLGQSGIRDALNAVAAVAKGRAAGACVVS
jgi:hypothetical protein